MPTDRFGIFQKGREDGGNMQPPAALEASWERRAKRLRNKRPVSPGFVVFGLRCAELAALIFSGLLAWYAYPELGPITQRALVSILGTSLLAGWLNAQLGAYRDPYLFGGGRVSLQMISWLAAIAALILLAFGWGQSAEYSRSWIFLWFSTGAMMLLVVRLGFQFLTGDWVRNGGLAQRIVVVGTGEHGRHLAQHLTLHPDVRARIIGFADHEDTNIRPAYIGSYRVVGGLARLREMIRNNEVDQAVIALPWSERDRIMGLVAMLGELPVHVRLAPELLRFEFPERRCDPVSGIPLLKVVDRPISGRGELVKSVEDFLLGSMLLLVCSPVMLLIALAIRIDSPGPIFFCQTRHGFNNNLIRVRKFRTMYQHLTDVSANVLTQRDDPRVTRIGRLLRRTSLDELPQLFNVVTGEMSLVGPRPHALQAKAGDTLYQDVIANYMARHRVKPGLTGWAQVNGWRGETDTHEKLIQRVQHDLYYIDNWSIWLDLWILLRTGWAVLRARNAF